MKYIRTKDGRIITFVPKEKYENDKATFDWFVANYCGGGINVLKIADTIEELCDELIIKNPNNDGNFYRKVFVYQNAWKNILNERHAKHCIDRDIYEHDVEIFGAIWTYDSNGAPTLKSVAKMNDKGELELCLD